MAMAMAMAMAMEEKQPQSIYSTRDEKMFSLKNAKCTVRTARFLNPCAITLDQASPVPQNTPLLCEIFSQHLQQWPSKVVFKGWKTPQPRWKDWVLQLSPKYSPIWRKAGIHEAIMVSVYEIRPNPELVLGLSEFWCPVTSTFVFPWGEATITLEDVMVLGGYPVLGKPVTSPIGGVEKMIQEMEEHRIEFSRSAAHKATHGGWLNQYMGKENEFEHLAFLSLWLSRYVFTSLPDKVIGKHVFPIAARLSQGTPMALAPAVLASLYKELGLLRKQAISCSDSITVTAPFQLVQLWVFERFPHLGPRSPNALERAGQARAARWHKLSSKASDLPYVRSALGDEGKFSWRPYCANLMNWRPPSHYQEAEKVFLDFSDLGRGPRSFARCLQACKLVGLGFKEVYLPHRVGRQFGFDQDIPATHEISFHANLEQVKFFVPSRSSEPGVSDRYLKWWKISMIARKNATKNSLELKFFRKYSRQIRLGDHHGFVVQKNVSNLKRPPQVLVKQKVEDGCTLSGSVPSPRKKEIKDRLDEHDDIPLSYFRDNGILLSRSVARASVASSAIMGRKRSLPSPERSSPVTPMKKIYHVQKGQSSGSTTTSRILPSVVAKRSSSHACFLSAINAYCENFRKKEHIATSGEPISTNNAASSVSRIGEAVERKGCNSLSDTNAAAGEVKRMGNLFEQLDHVPLSKRIKVGNGSRESAKESREERKEYKGKQSNNNPIKCNCSQQTDTSRDKKVGLLQRMERVEKIIGLKSNELPW